MIHVGFPLNNVIKTVIILGYYQYYLTNLL